MSNSNGNETCSRCQQYVVREGSEFGLKSTECGDACCNPCIIAWASSAIPQEKPNECPTCARVGDRVVIPANYFQEVDKVKSPRPRQKKRGKTKVEDNVKVVSRLENSRRIKFLRRRFAKTKLKARGSLSVRARSSSSTPVKNLIHNVSSSETIAPGAGAYKGQTSNVSFYPVQNVSDLPRCHPALHRRKKQRPGDLFDSNSPHDNSPGYERMQYENNINRDSPPSSPSLLLLLSF